MLEDVEGQQYLLLSCNEPATRRENCGFIKPGGFVCLRRETL